MGEGTLTCHVKGRLLMFTSASARKRNLKIVFQVGGPLAATWRRLVESLLSAAMTRVSGVPARGCCDEFIVSSALCICLVLRLRRRQDGLGAETGNPA